MSSTSSQVLPFVSEDLPEEWSQDLDSTDMNEQDYSFPWRFVAIVAEIAVGFLGILFILCLMHYIYSMWSRKEESEAPLLPDSSTQRSRNSDRQCSRSFAPFFIAATFIAACVGGASGTTVSIYASPSNSSDDGRNPATTTSSRFG